MNYGKAYKALELGSQYMGVHAMEIMNSLILKGTGKNNINHVHCDKNISIKTWADCFEGMFRVNCRGKYLIISLEIKGNYSKINKDEWMKSQLLGCMDENTCWLHGTSSAVIIRCHQSVSVCGKIYAWDNEGRFFSSWQLLLLMKSSLLPVFF